MGCFSFLCKECGKPILSDSYRGQEVDLFLLDKGSVQQHMSGQYNSYGGVFTEDLSSSVVWDLPWKDVCELIDNDDESSGIAAVHSACCKNTPPHTASEDDPHQGWGENYELMCGIDIL